MPVGTKPVNETLSVPGCSKAFAHLTYTGQHVQRVSRQAGVNRRLWPAGNLINPNAEPLDQKWLKEFSKIPAAALSDCLGRNVGGLGLRPFHGNAPMLGSALTVIVKPSDNLMNQVTGFKQWRFSDQTLHEYVTYMVCSAPERHW
jgi:hypothetical protein